MTEQEGQPPEQPEEASEELSPGEKRLLELDNLQEEIARRLKDNRRFLERFMDDSFEDEMEKELEDEEDEEPFEEL